MTNHDARSIGHMHNLAHPSMRAENPNLDYYDGLTGPGITRGQSLGGHNHQRMMENQNFHQNHFNDEDFEPTSSDSGIKAGNGMRPRVRPSGRGKSNGGYEQQEQNNFGTGRHNTLPSNRPHRGGLVHDPQTDEEYLIHQQNGNHRNTNQFTDHGHNQTLDGHGHHNIAPSHIGGASNYQQHTQPQAHLPQKTVNGANYHPHSILDQVGNIINPNQKIPDINDPIQGVADEHGILRVDIDEDWEDYSYLADFDKHDDDTLSPEANIPVPKISFKPHNYYYQVSYCLYCLALLVYIYIRLNFTLNAPGLNRIYCTVVAGLEIITCPSLLIQGMTLWRWKSRPEPPPDAFLTPKFHTIRIMIPTYKEPLDVVGPTIQEVTHMDVPPGLEIHAYVLDDGRRKYMEDYVLGLKTKQHVYIHYMGRPKLEGVPHHAKAGNINHTLRFIYDHGKTEGEACVIFDADFMPRRNYLLRVLPIFAEKRGPRPIGLVQTPQFFYNVNPDEDVWDHLNVSFFHRIEPSLDRWMAVNCCGTNFTVRSDALKDVGYFPVGCLTEDTLLSLRLCTMGWAVAYHHEVLAIGQSPHELTEVFKQRSRWCKGNLQIFCEDCPATAKGLTFPQKLFYSSCGYNYFCASISIPFFQLVPTWAIFFGLWPVSEISLKFALSFFCYYMLGNLLLLWPPVGFSIRDMWNGELASTNLWYTYFNGVRRIVGAKLFAGRGEMTFKSTKKKSGDEEEEDGVGFQKEDLRACFMHFIFFFIMLITIVYAVARAVMMEDVKFYYYFMYMIGMSWSLINMVPYFVVVVYCWYRVRIPGILCACLRNVQLLLRSSCGILILIQAWTTRNLTENFKCPHEYTAELGRSPLTMVRTIDVDTGLEIERNAFWLLGLKDDFYTIQQIKRSACEEDSIPLIVFFMHPSEGLQLDETAGHYMPDERILTWEEYDLQIHNYAKALAEVPSIIVMEPSLLMHTFNTRTEYHNTKYQYDYAQRVGKVIEAFPKSWIYVDAGNALYLQWTVNMDHIIGVLNNMPTGLRGFSVNVGSFVNSTYNMNLAMEMHCQSGLNFFVDTSRNGGLFSDRSLDEINECTYDPPYIDKGSAPGWGNGARNKKLNRASGDPTFGGEGAGFVPGMDFDIDAAGGPSYGQYSYGSGPPPGPDVYDYSYGNAAYGGVGGMPNGRKKRRKKRTPNPWEFVQSTSSDSYSDDYGGSYDDYSYDDGLTGDDGYDDPYGLSDELLACITAMGGHDGNAWIKTPGEADGRMFDSGVYQPCLLGHAIECSDNCPAYVPKFGTDFQRDESCQCN